MAILDVQITSFLLVNYTKKKLKHIDTAPMAPVSWVLHSDKVI